MPAPLAGATEAAIQSWLVELGSQITVGQSIAEIETEKAIVEFAADAKGTLACILVEAGETVDVGTPIAILLGADEGSGAVDAALQTSIASSPAPEPSVTPSPDAPEPETAPEQPRESPPPPTSSPEPGTDGARRAAPKQLDAAEPEQQSQTRRLFASPLVRRLARDRGLDLASIQGTGPHGRIVRNDLDRRPVAAAQPPSVDLATEVQTGVDTPLSPLRRAIARRLTESKTSVPHFYLSAHCRVDKLLQLRRELNQSRLSKISVNDFILKAVAEALRETPEANVTWGEDYIRRHNVVDLSIAIAIEGGLVTPVLRGVDQRTVSEINTAVKDLAGRAQTGRIKQHELEGGSFSVSNLGMYGVDEFAAILNPPQSGILAVAAAKRTAVVDEAGAIVAANVLKVTLSSDHRAIDGAVAAKLMAAFVRFIESPLTLLR